MLTNRVFMEHRWGQRIPCSAAVRVHHGDDPAGSGKMRNVSSSGAFIETSMRIPLFSSLAVVVNGIETLASVVRVERDGVAVEWCDPPGGSICTALGCVNRCAAAATR